MTTKKEYAVGDPVWIYGIGVKNNLTKGKVIKLVDLSDAGYNPGKHYIIEVPTYIDPLLEIRTWETMSQDDRGPIGAMRDVGELVSTIKMVKQTGFTYDEDYEEDGPSSEEIRAALEKSQLGTTHQPLILKENKPRRRQFNRKKKP